MRTMTEQLAEFSLGLRYSDLPLTMVSAVKRLFLDVLGCAIGAIGCEPALIAGKSMSPIAGPAMKATVIGGAVTSVEEATLINGVLARYLDFMDVYTRLDTCHPSENIPLALACVEGAEGSGKDLLEAIVVGYEAQMRLANAFSFSASGMHHVSAAGFVAPLVIGKAWKLSAPKVAHAVALSGMRHLTLSALARGRLSMAKAVGYPLSAMEAILATRLADNGFTGPLECLEWLFTEVPSHQKIPSQSQQMDFTRDPFQTENVTFKQFPVQFELQAPVEVAIRLHHKLGGSIAAIKRVVIEVAAITKKRTADPSKFRPANRETADHSLPCCVAMGLLDGSCDVEQFEHDRWATAEVGDLIATMEVVASAELEAKFPGKRPVRMTVELADASTHTECESVPLGDPMRPMTDDAVARKFTSLAEHRLGREKVARLIDMSRSLEKLADVRNLTALLVV